MSGRVAQLAERVCEMHETVVRTHAPAASPLYFAWKEPVCLASVS